MNKKVIGFLLAIPSLMGFGLTSCSDEASLAVNEPSQDKLVNVTVTASLADLTRASLTPENDKIKFEWDINDKITVVNADNGKYLGTLTVNEIQASDHRVCKFSGSAEIPAGEVNLNFFYLGKDKKATIKNDLTIEDYSVDFSQQNGSAASFSANDVLISTGKFTNVQDGNLGIINFDRNFAYGRFILKYNGDEIALAGKTVTISANSGNLYNKATLNFQTASYTKEEGSIVVTPTTNDFYVSFPETKGVNLKFEIEEFNGTKMEKLIADTYYIRNANGDPIVVEMRHSDGSDDPRDFKLIYKSNYSEGPADAEYSWKAVSPYSYTVKTYEKAFEGKATDLTREGYEFIGWAEQAEPDVNSKLYQAGDPYTVTYPNHTIGTLYAQWEQTEFDYTLVFQDKNGTTLDSQPIKGAKNEKVIVGNYDDTAAGKLSTEKKFKGWALKDAANDVVTTVDFDETHATVIVVPVFDKYEWFVKFIDEIDGTQYGNPARVASEEPTLVFIKQFPTTPTKDGYKFLGWKYDGKIVADYPENKRPVLTKNDLTPIIYATWEKLPDPNTIKTPGYSHGEFN